MKIIPAILPSSFRAIELGVEKVHHFVDTIQIDFVDGNFAPNRTWGFNNKDKDQLSKLLDQDDGLPYWQELDYEFDLMVNDPLSQIETFFAIGPSKIIFHLKSVEKNTLLKFFEELPEIIKETISFGIAVGVEEEVKNLEPFMAYIETVQCMGIAQEGFQGQAFDKRVLGQIKKIKELYPQKDISVDGGVSLETATQLVQAGAQTLIVGSQIFGNPNPESIIEKLKQVCYQALSVQEN